MKPSQAFIAAMLGASFTGVGSVVAGVWFIADNGVGIYNYFGGHQEGFYTLSDVIDDSDFGSKITIEMYNGIY